MQKVKIYAWVIYRILVFYAKRHIYIATALLSVTAAGQLKERLSALECVNRPGIRSDPYFFPVPVQLASVYNGSDYLYPTAYLFQTG